MPFSVLLVEDSPSLSALYSEYLRAEGGHVTHVNHGQDALEELRRNPCDLVILDIQLPDISGLEVLARLQELDPASVVIMITAHGTIDVAVEAMRNGAFDFIVKPFDAATLHRKVKAVMKKG